MNGAPCPFAQQCSEEGKCAEGCDERAAAPVVEARQPTPDECPKCGLEEWDYLYEAGRVSPSYKHCVRCDTEWSAQ